MFLAKQEKETEIAKPRQSGTNLEAFWKLAESAGTPAQGYPEKAWARHFIVHAFRASFFHGL